MPDPLNIKALVIQSCYGSLMSKNHSLIFATHL